MKKQLLILLLVLLPLAAAYFLLRDPHVHYHAGFLVYNDNTLVDFSETKYMELEFCNNNGTSKKDPQREKAHLHDNIGDVVHVHKKGALWGDLFTNLSYPLSVKNATFAAHLNGRVIESSDEFSRTPLKPYDSVVIFIGRNDDISRRVATAVARTKLLEVENRSESCGT